MMSDSKKTRVRHVVDFLRTANGTLAGSAAGATTSSRAAALEVQQDLDALLELYAAGGIPDPRAALREHTAATEAARADPSARVAILG
jgi:hypothetical protein